MPSMWSLPEWRRTGFKRTINLAKEACIQNPNDTKSKLKWVEALLGLAINAYHESLTEQEDCFREAYAKLDEVLVDHPENNEAMYLSVLFSYYMLITDKACPRKDEDSEARLGFCDRAIKHLKKVVEKSSEHYDGHDLMKYLQREAEICRGGNPTETDEDDLPEARICRSRMPTERDRGLSASPDHFESLVLSGEDTDFFEEEIARDPNSAEAWRKWGTALMDGSWQVTGNLTRVFIAEAIEKLENALLISPNDEQAKQELKKAYDQLLLERDRCFGAEMSDAEPLSINEKEYLKQLVTQGHVQVTDFFKEKINGNDYSEEVWRDWGTALMKLSSQESGNKKRALIAGTNFGSIALGTIAMNLPKAIRKLEAAFMISTEQENALRISSPKDKKVAQELMKAYDQLFTEYNSCLPRLSCVDAVEKSDVEPLSINENEVADLKNINKQWGFISVMQFAMLGTYFCFLVRALRAE